MPFHNEISRWVSVAGCLVGGAGVAFAAAASHGGSEELLGSAAQISLAHGPALLALGLFGLRSRFMVGGAALLAGGTLLFAGDLVFRHFAGPALFPGAAPIGGLGMIAGWAALVPAMLMLRE